MADTEIGQQDLIDDYYKSKDCFQRFLYYKNGSEKPNDDEWNIYSHPLHMAAMMDLDGTNRPHSSIPPISSFINNCHDSTNKYNTKGFKKKAFPQPKPIELK